MKTNRDQLNDALHSLRDDTVSEVVAAMEAPAVSKTVRPRRWMAATAACLCGLLVLGAVAALPMLHAEPPTVPPATEPLPPKAESAYYNAPIVRLDQLSATETATVSDPSIPSEKLEVQFSQAGIFSDLYVLVFDCLPGETVTVRAGSECLGYVGMVYDPDADFHGQMNFRNACDSLVHRSNPVKDVIKWGAHYDPNAAYTYYKRKLTFDPSTSSVVLLFEYTAPDDGIEEDTVLYTISNEEGQITGAGGLYVGKKYIGSAAPHTAGGALGITRASILGSVRFTDPAAVTEEQVETLLSAYAEAGKDGRGRVDFTPVTSEEILNVAGREIIDTLFEGKRTSGVSREVNYYADYSFFGVYVNTSNATENTRENRRFIVFADGTWAELKLVQDEYESSNGHSNPECPNTEQYGQHGVGNGCIIQTTDGRFYQLDESTAVLIQDPATYTNP